MPMDARHTGGGVVYNLIYIGRNRYLTLSYGLWLCLIYWAGKVINIALRPHHILTRIIFNTVPGAAVMLCILRHDIGQAKALRHRFFIMHVAVRGPMPPILARSFVIL